MKKHETQPENRRIRAQALIRMLPGVRKRLYALAAAEGLSVADFTERLILAYQGPVPGAEPEKDSEKDE